MAASFSTVPFVLGLLFSCGGAMLGDVFYTENKLNPATPELHPIHREIKYSDGGYTLPEDFAPLSYGNVDAKDVTVIEGQEIEEMDKNGNSSDIESTPEIYAEDFTNGGASKTEIKQEEDKNAGISTGERKMNKPLAIGTIAGITIMLSAFGSIASIIIAIIKKKKSHKTVVA